MGRGITRGWKKKKKKKKKTWEERRFSLEELEQGFTNGKGRLVKKSQRERGNVLRNAHKGKTVEPGLRGRGQFGRKGRKKQPKKGSLAIAKETVNTVKTITRKGVHQRSRMKEMADRVTTVIQLR